MLKSFNLEEVEALVTTRVLTERLINPKDNTFMRFYSYNEALFQCMYVLNDILLERGLNHDYWARVRKNRLFLFYLPLKRIAMEVGVVTDGSNRFGRSRFQMQFVGYKGKFLPETAAELIEILLKTSAGQHRRKYDKDHRNQTR